ncbi:MFS transporter [Mammaliicoccus sp. Dog046]|uniref:MFS transporter n=1 Tax=Mammaliicoccus sp. Dog046 TaxID=3034233 RepID=UPI002B257C68|nr:MFS transporter [Mammaliicoccus sp. Dog046]WQK84960.1 MFS transporter [Mammaliicoccus sp. Dog046]
MADVSRGVDFNKKLYPPMILGSILNPINSSMLAVALVPIAQAFGIPFYQTAWLVSSLYLATSIGQPVIGKLIDIFGPRGLFLFATSLVGLASIIALFSSSFYGLVLARFLIGIGTCAGYPSAMYLIKYEGERTGKESPSTILTLLSISNQTISVIGPTIGGLLVTSGGWQAIFIVNLPMSILSFVFGYLYFPKIVNKNKLQSIKVQVDFIGIILFTITLSTWMIFFMEPHRNTLYLLIIGFITFVSFILFELKSKKPFIDLRVLGHNTALNNTYLRTFLSMIVSYSVLYGYIQWLEDVKDLTPAHAGLMMLPQFLVGLIMAQLTGTRLSIKAKLYIGTIGAIITMAGFQFINAQTPIIILILLSAVFGLPQGLLNLANQNAVYHQAPRSIIGMSAGLLRTCGYIGAIVSSTLIGMLFKGESLTVAMHQLGFIAMLISIIIMVLTVLGRNTLNAR